MYRNPKKSKKKSEEVWHGDGLNSFDSKTASKIFAFYKTKSNFQKM